jgi:hypothetical protein
MYLEFGEPISTTAPARANHAKWVETVKGSTQHALEQILSDLQQVRDGDPYRSLNPLAWTRAAQAPQTIDQVG